MSDKIVNLRGGWPITAPGEPVPCVVEYLQEMLEEAKAGNLIAIALVKVDKDMRMCVNWRHAGGTHVSNALTAGITDLAYVMGKHRSEDSEDET